MILHRHRDLEGGSSAPGLFRIICMDQNLGSGAITQGMVTIEPGRQSRPHTHRVEESMTLLDGRLRVLIGTEVVEVDAPATFLAPANTVHSLRNVGGTPAVLCIAYPSVNVGTYFVDGVDF
jgi:quercetin dioxygenase-like cupin family protein